MISQHQSHPLLTPHAPGNRPAPADDDRLVETLGRARAALLRLQRADGQWCGELQGDSILESEYLLMKFILGQEDVPMADGRPGRATLMKIAACLRSQQREDGGWGQYPGAPIDLSAAVKAYFALKLMGDSPAEAHMRAARQAVLAHGGAERCNSFSNFYLACLGQVSWRAVPAIPPEIIWLPRWFYFHVSKVSAWTRTMILPLAIVATLRPTRSIPRERGIDELFVDQRQRHRLKLTNPAPRFWRAAFLAVDRALKLLGALLGARARGPALRRAMKWILDRAGQDGPAATAGLGAIFPPMVYIQIALKAMGHRRDDPIVQRAERELDEFFIEDDASGTIRIQPCFSPVWDTGIALYALADCGMDERDAPARSAANWLRGRECRHVGDWAANLSPARRRGRDLGAWSFEYHNGWYPDVDDTAMVAMALRRIGGAENVAAARRGVAWILAMQNDDGGWAAFDRTRHRPILEYVPFADHNAMQDPSCPDITGRVLECLAWHGFTWSDAPVRHAIDYIRSRQEPEGCFFGRWGVNYIYGTWQAVIGPIRCGEPRDEPWIQRAGGWIRSIQHEDGSFGESADSYLDRSSMGRGPATASQTAWAAMILLEIYGADDCDLHRALNWLASSQLNEADAPDPILNPDGDLPGGWVEPWFTGTGFPRVFYLRYHLYRLYFPLMALGRFVAAASRARTRTQAIETGSAPTLLARR